jgi:L-histidine N-alpha-methyltransferase
LEAAYDDRTGATAAFNKNLLARMNREIDADFDFDAFTFRATYDHEQGAINSYLVSARSQSVRIGAAHPPCRLRSATSPGGRPNS